MLHFWGAWKLEDLQSLVNLESYFQRLWGVYDVSSSANFQPGAPYHFLAGADATVGLAMMSYDRSLVNSLRYGELEAGDWHATFIEIQRSCQFEIIGSSNAGNLILSLEMMDWSRNSFKL